MDNTLLALLLALKNLDNPLSEKEREALAGVGKRLKSDPGAWNFTKKKLMAIIKANDRLSQLYQEAKAKLDALDRPIPPDLLPTDAELEKVLPPESKGYKRARFGGERDEENNEILNMTISVLQTPEPAETTKKLTPLEKLSQFLNLPTKKND